MCIRRRGRRHSASPMMIARDESDAVNLAGEPGCHSMTTWTEKGKGTRTGGETQSTDYRHKLRTIASGRSGRWGSNILTVTVSLSQVTFSGYRV